MAELQVLTERVCFIDLAMFALKMLLLIPLYGFSYSSYMETCTFPVTLVSIVWVHVLLVMYNQNCHLESKDYLSKLTLCMYEYVLMCENKIK